MERGYYSEKDAADAVRQICCALEVSVEECNDFIVFFNFELSVIKNLKL